MLGEVDGEFEDVGARLTAEGDGKGGVGGSMKRRKVAACRIHRLRLIGSGKRTPLTTSPTARRELSFETFR